MNLGLWGSISPKTILGAVRRGAAGASTYTISGVVYDADGTTAVSGATVALGAYSTASAGDGTYTLSGIAPGTSGSMTCTKAGYLWTSISVSAMSGNLTAQNYTNTWYAAGGSLAAVVGSYRATGAASQAASYVNLANPGTADLTAPVPPTWNATDGWIFNGSTHLRAAITPTNDQTWSAFIAYSNLTVAAFKALFGSVNAGKAFMVMIQNATTMLYYSGGSASKTHAGRLAGVAGIAGTKAYWNGVDEGITIPASAGALVSLAIGADNTSGSYQDNSTNYTKAFIVHNAILTPTQAAILSTAMANF